MKSNRITVSFEDETYQMLLAGSKSSGLAISELVRFCVVSKLESEPNVFLKTERARDSRMDAWLKKKTFE